MRVIISLGLRWSRTVAPTCCVVRETHAAAGRGGRRGARGKRPAPRLPALSVLLYIIARVAAALGAGCGPGRGCWGAVVLRLANARARQRVPDRAGQGRSGGGRAGASRARAFGAGRPKAALMGWGMRARARCYAAASPAPRRRAAGAQATGQSPSSHRSERGGPPAAAARHGRGHTTAAGAPPIELGDRRREVARYSHCD